MSAYGLHGQYGMRTDKHKICRILSQEKGMYFIISECGEQLAEVSGKFRYTRNFTEKKPVCAQSRRHGKYLSACRRKYRYGVYMYVTEQRF